MLGIKITDSNRFNKVCSICFEQASKNIYRGRIDGSVTIYLNDDEITFTGEHGVNDYEERFGFVIIKTK